MVLEGTEKCYISFEAHRRDGIAGLFTQCRTRRQFSKGTTGEGKRIAHLLKPHIESKKYHKIAKEKAVRKRERASVTVDVVAIR